MADSNSTGTTRDYGVFTAGNALRTLWQQCEYTAPQELVEWMASHATGEASRQLTNLAEVVGGLGCLVMSDGDGGGLKTGNFQEGDSVGNLLFTISSTIESLAALAAIGSDADFLKANPEKRALMAKAAAT